MHAKCQQNQLHHFYPLLFIFLGLRWRRARILTPSTRNQHSSCEGRAVAACWLCTHKHTNAEGYADAVGPSAAFFIFCVFSRCCVLFVTPFLRSAPLGSLPGDLSQPLTASGALLDWIYMICPSISGENGRERNGSASARSEIETRRGGGKIGMDRRLKAWNTHKPQNKTNEKTDTNGSILKTCLIYYMHWAHMFKAT